MSAGDKVLVVGPSWVGDMVMAQSLYRSLAVRRPGVEIHVLAPTWSLPIVGRMPEVARAIELDVGHGELGLAKRRALGLRLRGGRYNQAIVLPRSLKAALVPFLARIPVRTGLRGEWRFVLINDTRELDPDRLDSTVLRYVALGSAETNRRPRVLPPKLATDPDNQRALADRLGIASERPVVALLPGAEYGPAKRWPIENYGELAERLARAGAAVWVIGSVREKPLGERVRELAPDPNVHDLCGASTLVDAIDLLAAAAVAVSNDSGLMHVAAAVGAHVVAIYGSTSPDFTPPLTDAKTICYENLACSPCFERHCPLEHLNCLRGITVDVVFEAAMNALAAGVGGERGSGQSRVAVDG
ncbi:lipopolysaccharide heptosyltransferase II [Candidatus Rariloculus sp.]|uniref:lipopolysaccharide heptosyltransferase II n=1 Tax=Candidatus Rariloculus sp. TaxID=3101265 RepID=UPI003D0A85EF